MKDTEFFSDLLGIKFPWYIERVATDHQLKRVDIWLAHVPGVEFPCPECQAFHSVYDHAPEREIRHLNTCQMATYLHVRVPRVSCSTHGIKQIVSGLGDDNAKITYEFERLVLDLEQECSVESVCRLVQVDWHLAWRIYERAVERGLARKPHRLPERIGVDEKSFARGHQYESLVYDLDRGTVEYVVDDREQESLERFFAQYTTPELNHVQAIAMDMWDPYFAATKAYVPDADKKITFDRYHVMKIVLDAVDKVRKEEHQHLLEQGNDILKGTKYLWLWNEENVPDYRREEFKRFQSLDLKVCRARAIKENLRHLWSYCREGWMRNYFADWYHWATHSRLQPIIKAAKTLKAHLDNIVTYARHHITNALGESLNSKIEKVKRLACGFRNRAHYRTAIFFHCGGLDLYPRRINMQSQIISS
jgi:transposase